MSETGVGEMGDIMLMSFTGDSNIEPETNEGYRSRFSKDIKIAKPGYYSVNLDDDGVKTELTTSRRVGFHKFSFLKNKEGIIIIEPEHGIQDTTVKSHLTVVDGNYLQRRHFNKIEFCYARNCYKKVCTLPH